MNNQTNRLAQLRQKQRILQIFVFSLITVVVWITFSMFRSQKKTVITAQQLKLAESLNPSIRIEVLDKLDKKQLFAESELTGFPIYKILVAKDGKSQSMVTIDTPDESAMPVVQPTPSPTPQATASATQNLTNQ